MNTHVCISQHSLHKVHLCELSRNMYMLNYWTLYLFALCWFTLNTVYSRWTSGGSHCTSYGECAALVTNANPFISSPTLILSNFSANIVSPIVSYAYANVLFLRIAFLQYLDILEQSPNEKQNNTLLPPQALESWFPNSLSFIQFIGVTFNLPNSSPWMSSSLKWIPISAAPPHTC